MFKKYGVIIGLCLALVIFATACQGDEGTDQPLPGNGQTNGDTVNGENGENGDERDKEEEIELEYTEEGIIKPEIAEKIIEERATEVIEALRDQDAYLLSYFVHEDRGVRFTPYTNVSVEEDVVLSKEEIAEMFESEQEYIWGRYDGKGNDIELTPSEYYEEFIYTADFVNAEQIGYNEILSSGNMLENQFEVYDDPIIVEYYFPGFDEDYKGMDWLSLRLVFEQMDDEWYLVGIIHNQWTI
ncbi:hypothetical protein RH915_08970 [Serpentinicella sp. ANB-PHB4]|uniref:hypothetical protein n=1 Tax=Serpentinicella sp. ANB-PHB4 TaxID=3074076 RepID=UPI002857E263|nr:hypothetical protein [Serpentinicella sp. ANB-PHB4]MDR5659625.1 hypothetical protein [Serpentinicella sp. ANB-PHB4]